MATENPLLQQLEVGRNAFAHLMRVWHQRNGWSHSVLPHLAHRLLLGRVHASQISMFKNSKLLSPGPEVFLALGGVNGWLWPWCPEQQLKEPRLAGTTELELLRRHPPLALLNNNGRPLGPGQFLEIFTGLTAPPAAFDLRIEAHEGPTLSGALAECLTASQVWRQCKHQVLAAYPVEQRRRRQRFAAVMAGQDDYTAPELETELQDLYQTAISLGRISGNGGPTQPCMGIDEFLQMLRKHQQRPAVVVSHGRRS